MMVQATVRLAEAADAEALAALNKVFNDGTVEAQQIAAYLMQCPEEEKTVVAEVAGEIAGFACLQIYHAWCYPDPWAELTELYVQPAYRRQGVAQAMVSQLETLARNAGVTAMILYTNEHNSAAQALYRRCGYTQQVEYIFRKTL